MEYQGQEKRVYMEMYLPLIQELAPNHFQEAKNLRESCDTADNLRDGLIELLFRNFPMSKNLAKVRTSEKEQLIDIDAFKRSDQ